MNLKSALLVLVACLPALAHHSFAAEYDSQKTVTLKAKFVSLEWVNPHAWLHFAVTNADSKVVQWKCEMPPPNSLYRSGWTKEILKPGDDISITGFLAKDGSPTLWGEYMVLPNGSQMKVRSIP